MSTNNLIPVILFFVFFLFPVRAFGGEVTFAWDANTEPDLAGYKVYSGTSSGNYTQSVDVGNTTEYTQTGLQEGITYYFALTAYDTAGNESGFTTELVIALVDNEGAYDIWLSTSPDRSNPRLLHNQSCSGNIYMFTGPDDDIQRVTFYLDGVAHQVEYYPAYDFEGTAGNGLANPCDTTQFVDGEHEIKAVIESVTGITEEVTAVFTVNN